MNDQGNQNWPDDEPGHQARWPGRDGSPDRHGFAGEQPPSRASGQDARPDRQGRPARPGNDPAAGGGAPRQRPQQSPQQPPQQPPQRPGQPPQGRPPQGGPPPGRPPQGGRHPEQRPGPPAQPRPRDGAPQDPGRGGPPERARHPQEPGRPPQRPPQRGQAGADGPPRGPGQGERPPQRPGQGERPVPPNRGQQPPAGQAGARSTGRPGRDGRRPGAPDNRERPPRRPADRGGQAGAAGAAAGARTGDPEAREPELITHRAYNGTDDGAYDDYGAHDGYDGFGREDYDADGYDPDGRAGQRLNEAGLDDDPPRRGKKSKAALSPAQRKKRRWKIIRRSLYAFVGLFMVLPAAAFAITYFLVEVPAPEDVAEDQAKVVTYYYADGQTEMGRDIPQDGGNRILLEYSQIPEEMRHAAYAAEDATFETNPGFDITGILRAAYNQLTGGVGGGSTITQQYIKVASGNDEYSLTRKWTEIAKAFKMNNEQTKQEVITAYLNTIYFGRGAYGLQTAAQSFFGKDAQELNASESAMLAGLIQQPGRSENLEVVKERWSYVLDQMVANNWLPRADREAATFPNIIPLEQSKPDTISGPERFIQQRVKAELAEKGYPEEKLHASGYKVYLTIDQRAQKLATETVNSVMDGQPQKLNEALVAVDPNTGAVRAYYGGPYKPGVNEYDWASAQRNPGSSFKPFDLVALLRKGKGLGEIYDGSSPRTFSNVEVFNSENTQCPRCTVAEAMERSINTVFYDMVLNDVGPKAVADAARDAGIPEEGSGVNSRETMPAPDGNISIGGGGNVVSPTHMASAYATFASGGIRHDTHFVAKVTTADGEVVFDETTDVATEGEPAFSDDPEQSKRIAGNVTESLKPVLTRSNLACADERACAGKTGTHQYDDGSGSKINENSEAWMVGYNPQISTAVWVGTGGNEPIRTAAGAQIYGSGLPGEIWKKFMDSYLQGKPRMQFEQVEPIGAPPTTSPPVTDDASPSEETEEASETRETSETSEPSEPSRTESSAPEDSDDMSIPSQPDRRPNWPWENDDEDDSGGNSEDPGNDNANSNNVRGTEEPTS